MNEQKRSNRKRWIWLGVGLVVVVVIGALAVPMLFGPQLTARMQNEAVSTGETVTAFIGDLTANATASGQIEARRDARLTLSASGEVVEIYTAVGAAVAAGDPLLKVDTAALERAVESAQQSLRIQEANLAALLAPPTASNLASAEASYVTGAFIDVTGGR